jgi:hypothetical protein
MSKILLVSIVILKNIFHFVNPPLVLFSLAFLIRIEINTINRRELGSTT